VRPTGGDANGGALGSDAGTAPSDRRLGLKQAEAEAGRTAAALKERENRLVEAQRLARLGSWSVEAATGVQVWSDELYRLWGFEPQSFEPDMARLFDRLHPEDAEPVREACLAQMATPVPWAGEFRVILPDGTTRWLETRMAPLEDDAGTVVGAHGITQDITERKVAEEQVRFRADLLEAVGLAIVGTDLSGSITYWGPGAENLYGWTAQEVLGRKIADVVAAASDEQDRIEARTRLGRGERWAGTLERGRRDGSRFLAQLTTTPVLDGSGQLVGNISIGADVSLREQASAELARARDHAIEASLLKSHFLANMSHEIRTPMNGVLGMTELLLTTALDTRQREYAEIVHTSGDALMTILNDILDLSKIEAGRLDLEYVDFDVAAVIEDVAELFASQAHAKGLELVTSMGGDVPAAVRGDPGRLRQVLSNLLGNAIKFTSRGLVMVTATVDRSEGNATTLRLQVDDTGIGIDEQQAARIFEPFIQADSTTTRQYGGTGLGLTITRQLVELMGGECGVDSEVGVGSSFWCTVALQGARHISTSTRSQKDSQLGGMRVLVVDDNPTNGAVLEGYLLAWGMNVVGTGSGMEALDAARAAEATGQPFALALIDQSMPTMNGLELANAFAVDPALAGTAVVLLTSSDDDGEPAGSADIAAHLPKPVRREHLRRCLHEVIVGAQATADPPSAETARTGRGRVLLAEDNAINQQVALAMLEDGGYQVDVVDNGVEAVSAVRARRYDAVLMDCQMPRMNGVEAALAIRAEEGGRRRAPIIALTAGAMPEDRDRCLAAGMDDYVSKPFRKGDLLAVVARWAANDTPEGRVDGTP
jgi:two-component system sensor histidine kinase/response regulator